MYKSTHVKGILLLLVLAMALGGYGVLAYPVSGIPDNAKYTDFTGQAGYRGDNQIGTAEITYANDKYIYNPKDPTRTMKYDDNTTAPIADVINWDAADGVFGKKTGDTVMKSEIKDTVLQAYYPTSGVVPFINVMPGSAHKVAERESLVLTYEVAFADFNVDRSLQLKMATPTGSGKDPTGTNALNILNGDVKLFGTAVKGLTLATNTWYHIQLIMTAGSADGTTPNLAELYVNGKSFGTKEFDADKSDEAMTKMEYVNSARFMTTFAKNGASKSYKPAITYYDNIYLAAYQGELQYTPFSPVLTHTDSDIQAMLSAANGFMPVLETESRTVADVLDENKLSTDGMTAYMTSAAGEILNPTESIVDNYLVFEKKKDTMIYFFKKTDSKIWNQNFNTGDTIQEIKNQVSAECGNNAALGYNNKTIHNIGIADALGGKISGDKAAVIQNNLQYDSKYPDPFFSFYTNAYAGANIMQKATIEVSMYTDGAADFALSYTTDGNDSGIRELLKISPQAQVSVNGMARNDIRWEHGRWYRIAAVLTPGSAEAELFINGKTVGKFTVNTTLVAIQRIKLGYSAKAESAGNMITLGVDDFNMYYGDYKPQVLSLTSTDNEVAYVDDGNEMITVLVGSEDEEIDAFDLSSALNPGQGKLTFYTDDTFKTDCSNDYVGNGYYAILSSQDEVSRRYYKIAMLAGNVVGISKSNYTYDNVQRTVSGVLRGTPVDTFLGSFELFEGHTAKVVKDNVDIGAGSVIYDGMKLKISKGNESVDYNIVLDTEFDENFDNISFDYTTADSINQVEDLSLIIPPVETEARIKTEIPEGRNSAAVHFTSTGQTSNDIPSRNMGIQKASGNKGMGNVIAVEVSVCSDDTSAAFILNGIYRLPNDSKDKYLTLAGISQGGRFTAMNRLTEISAKTGQWYRLQLVMERTTGAYRFYIDGILQAKGTERNLINLEYFSSIRLQHVTWFETPRSTWGDDFKLYNAYDINCFDGSGTSAAISSDKYFMVQDKFGEITINGHDGDTVATVLSGIRTSGRANVVALNADGSQIGDTSVASADGMIIRVSSAEGLAVRDYKLARETLVGPIRLEKDEAGNTTASVNIQSAKLQKAALVLAEYHGNQLVKVVFDKKNDIMGKQTLTCKSNVTEGNKIKAMILEDLENMIPLANSVEG